MDRTVEHFTARAERYDRSSRWCTDEALLARIVALIDPQPGHHHLDVACGTGLVARCFRGRVARQVGLDLTPAMAEQARGVLDELVIGRAEQMPFADASFDSVTCRQGIQFMDAPAALAEMVRVTRPGGRICSIDLCAHDDSDRADTFEILRLRNPARRNFFLAGDVPRLLEEAGCSRVDFHRWSSDEDVDVWADNGAITDGARVDIRAVYRAASPEFRRLHAVREEEGRLVDRMLFGITVGTR